MQRGERTASARPTTSAQPQQCSTLLVLSVVLVSAARSTDSRWWLGGKRIQRSGVRGLLDDVKPWFPGAMSSFPRCACIIRAAPSSRYATWARRSR